MDNRDMEADVTFRICVPTYNRGNKALELVNDVLPKLESGWVLTIIDNCSVNGCAEYEEIARLADRSAGRLAYIRNKYNMLFHGNYMNCHRLAGGKPHMIVCDEDRPGLSTIPKALKLFQDRPGTGIFRGSVSPLVAGSNRQNSFVLKDALYSAGGEALRHYAMSNNYFSGTIYNTPALEAHGFIDRLEKNLSKQRFYPHLYLEGICCAVLDVATSSEPSCYEGPPQYVADGPGDYIQPYSFGGRLDSFLVLRDCLREAVELMGEPFDAVLFTNLYLAHAAKYCYLVGRANAALYANNSIDVGVAVRAFAYFACASMIRLKECEAHRDFIMNEIDRLARQFGG